METKNTDSVVLDKLKNLRFDSHFIVSASDSGSGGLILLWRKDLNVQILNSSKNLIDTIISHKGITFHASFIYGESDVTNRSATWNLLSQTFSGRSSPWFVTGDLNEILENGEKSGGALRAEGSFGLFRNFLAHNDLFDLKICQKCCKKQLFQYS